MIRVFLGKPGSGKTLMMVKEMCTNPEFNYISNIRLKGKSIKNCTQITHNDIFQKKVEKIKKDGTPVYRYYFNKEYWINLRKDNPGMNIVIDEVHRIYDARRSMSAASKIFNDFMALIRKIMSSPDDEMSGNLTLITQIDRRLDIVGIEMATQIRYHICTYTKTCTACGAKWYENNECPLPRKRCPHCNKTWIRTTGHVIDSYYFSSLPALQQWRFSGMKTYFHHTRTFDAKNYFNKYDTYQWDDLMDDD